jgi:iron(III) transport system substrate-binding protein
LFLLSVTHKRVCEPSNELGRTTTVKKIAYLNLWHYYTHHVGNCRGFAMRLLGILVILVIVAAYYYQQNPEKFKKYVADITKSVSTSDFTKGIRDVKKTIDDTLAGSDKEKNRTPKPHKHGDANAAELTSINVYSARKEELSRELFELFERQYGVKVNFITDEVGKLLARATGEKNAVVMDVLLTADALSLHIAAERDLLEPLPADIVALVPASLRESGADPRWIAVTKRARVIAYAKDRVDPTHNLSTYEDLALPVWKGRLVTRSSTNSYNQLLIASMLYNHGAAALQDWCHKVSSNFARHPQGGDTDQIKAVASGIADVALVNHYYYARLLTGDEQDRAIAAKVAVLFPNQGDRGTHINISGVGIAKGAKHQKEAAEFIRFLLSDEAQRIYAFKNNEYPVRPIGTLPQFLQDSIRYKFDEDSIDKIVNYYAEAEKISLAAGWL